MAFSNLVLSTSFPEQAFYFYIKKTFPNAENRYFFKNGKRLVEADIFIPEINVAIEYDGLFFHKDKKTQDEKKNLFLKNKNVQLIRIRENMKNEKLPVLVTHGCHIIERSDPSSIHSLEKSILDTFKFIKNNFKIKGSFAKIDVSNDQTEIHKCFERWTLEKSIATTHPDIAKQWHISLNGPLKPEHVTYGSKTVVWWKCSADPTHEPWEGLIRERAEGHKLCQTCQSFSVTHPHLLNEWNLKENTKRKLDPKILTYGSGSVASWKCKVCKNDFDMKIGHKSEGRPCPHCNKNKKKPVPYERSLAYRFPEVAKEWDFEKNNGLTPSDVFGGSSGYAYWICSKNNNHKWKAKISNRTSLGRGCSDCNGGVKK